MNIYEFTELSREFPKTKLTATGFDADTIAWMILDRSQIYLRGTDEYKEAKDVFIELTTSCTTKEAMHWMKSWMFKAIEYGSDTKELNWRQFYLAAYDIHNDLCKKQRSEGERKYPLKESYRFNLESMNDTLWCIEYDIRDGKLKFPFDVAGRMIKDEDDLEDLRNECYELLYHTKVTGKEYGRVKEIVAWRVQQRYARCLASGMSEADAGRCFEDM